MRLGRALMIGKTDDLLVGVVPMMQKDGEG
jgi:hypothetical protein